MVRDKMVLSKVTNVRLEKLGHHSAEIGQLIQDLVMVNAGHVTFTLFSISLLLLPNQNNCISNLPKFTTSDSFHSVLYCVPVHCELYSPTLTTVVNRERLLPSQETYFTEYLYNIRCQNTSLEHKEESTDRKL